MSAAETLHLYRHGVACNLQPNAASRRGKKAETFLAIVIKAIVMRVLTAVGRGGLRLLSGPGPELRLCREREEDKKCAKIIDGMSQKKKHNKISNTCIRPIRENERDERDERAAPDHAAVGVWHTAVLFGDHCCCTVPDSARA